MARYSHRSATIGATFVAFIAGRYAAASATDARKIVTPAKDPDRADSCRTRAKTEFQKGSHLRPAIGRLHPRVRRTRRLRPAPSCAKARGAQSRGAARRVRCEFRFRAFAGRPRRRWYRRCRRWRGQVRVADGHTGDCSGRKGFRQRRTDVFCKKSWCDRVPRNLFFSRIGVREIRRPPGKEIEVLKSLP
jgi:hypothetical protein